MKALLVSIITIFVLGILAANQFAFAENTWYLGEGLKEGDYFRYKLCQLEYKSCTQFEMDFWVNGKTPNSDWDMKVLVIEGNKIEKENMQVSRISPEPINSSETLNPYADVYKKSIAWLSGFATKAEPFDFEKPVSRPVGFAGPQIKLTSTKESVNLSAGKFETYVVSWYKGIDNKIWVVDNFPFPVKALTYIDLENFPVQYQFELLEYGNSSVLPNFFENHPNLSLRNQLASGLLSGDIVCRNGLQLIFKSKDNSPACVKPQTAKKLLERGWNKMPHGWLSHIDIVGTVGYERFPTPGHFAFCESFTLIPDHVDKAKLGNITSSKITLFKNIRVGGGDEVYVDPPFDRLTENIKEKKIHVVGELFREFETGCHNWYKDSSGRFTGEIEKETNPVLVPKEIEILSDN